MYFRSILLLAHVLLFAAVLSPPTSASTPKPPPCEPGQYLLPAGERVIDGDDPLDVDAIVLTADGRVRIASGCAEHPARQKIRKRGTRVKVKWPTGACDGLSGRARLTATIDVDCTAMQGRVVAKKFRRDFTARRSACGDGVLDVDGGEACPSLEGPPAAPALGSTTDFDAGGVPAAGEIDVDANGATLVRTQLEVGFAPGATVADVNAALASVSGTIVSMLDDVPIIGIRFPDPGSVEALDGLVATLGADPAVRFVRKAYMPAPKVVPVLTPPLDVFNDFKFVEHHLAAGAGAAWNVRAALPSVAARPFVVVADFFGNGPPDDAFDINERDFDFQTGAASDHGYHVLGIIAARFDGLADPAGRRGRDVATGMFPGTVPVRIVDGQPAHRLENQALIEVAVQASAGGRVVVNTSLGFLCTNSALEQALCANPGHFLPEARAWIEKVRGRGLEGSFLHVASAGNLDFGGANPNLKTDSEFTTAALLTEAELSVPPLTNTLVVDNRRTYRAIRPFRPDCLNPGSRRGGQLSAMGTEVWSLTDARGDTAAGFKTGTSMATPQVAGTAAYLWALAPQLSPQDVKGLILQTARPVPECSGEGEGVPVIDAYAAVLTADRGGTLAVRRALLDVADGGGLQGTNGRFDVWDVALLKSELEEANGATDYSRFDLNGDGNTGGTARRRFDLDANDLPAYSTLTRTVDGRPRDFDENALTDLDVLCYYAFSPLFQAVSGLSSPADLLGDECTCPPAGAPRAAGLDGSDQCVSTTTTTLPGAAVLVRQSSQAAASVSCIGQGVLAEDTHAQSTDTGTPPGSFGGTAEVQYDGDFSTGGATATHAADVVQNGGFVTAMSGSGGAAANVSAEFPLYAGCFQAAGGTITAFTFDVTGSVPYAVSATPTASAVNDGQPSRAAVTLTGPGGTVYFVDSMGGVEGAPSGVLGAGRYAINGVTSSNPRMGLIEEGETGASAQSNVAFSITLGGP